MALNATPYFPWIPLGYWRLETMELSITSILFSVLAYGQAGFFLLDRSMPPFSKGFWGRFVGHSWSIYFGRPYLCVGYQGYVNKVMWVSIDGGISGNGGC